jgi:E3 ubiquitin-protein ligase mind-bomb
MVLIKKILARMNSESVNAQNEYGWTALHDAIIHQSEIAVKELLKRDDVDVNLKNNVCNVTSLHYACCFWKNMPIDLFTKILEKSADVNAQDERGNTALHVAIIEENKTAVKVLLKRKEIDFNLNNNQNHTALHYACCLWKNIPGNLLTKILEKSADVNVQEKGGHTALHWAIILENRTAVEELLKRKDVNVNLKNNNNQTALHSAAQWKDIPIDLFTKILEESTDVNAQTDKGTTALHWATFKQSTTAVEELLKRDDVIVNLKNNNNVTALHYACCWKDDLLPIELFTKILEKSTDINAKDENGCTALHLAIALENRTAVEELLKRDDVNVNVNNNNNQTALNLCSKWKDIPAHLLKIINEKTTAENKAT